MSNLDSKSIRLNEIRLTETVQKGGCAAKLPAGSLRDLLQKLEISKPPALTVGTENMDDACLWNLDSKSGLSVSGGSCLVQTLDFFTPIVDDPYDFGAIAATNAISDVYAMGGAPKIALSILAFPSQTLPLEILQPLLKGALDKIHEAGACLAGGHTIDDDTLKFGLSVTGFVRSDRAWINAGAKPGDALILTKAIGTGTITSALKRREVSDEIVAGAIESMKQLNRAPELLESIEVHAATDITGFGLAGHAMQMARASGVQFRFNTAQIPVLQGARECLEKKIVNRAHRTNWEYVQNSVQIDGVSEISREILRLLIVDPQTSGGLLLSVPQAQAAQALDRLKTFFQSAQIIGEVLPGSRTQIEDFCVFN